MSGAPRWSRDAKFAKMLISRLDGTLDATDLATLTGASEEEVARLLGQLEKAGLVGFEEEERPEPEVQGGVAEDVRARIIGLYDRLDRLDHYGLLGVSATADAKTIRRAYFAQAKLYHPDRFFGRDIGALKGKVEAIFKAMTTASDVLMDASRRADYDNTLRGSLRMRMSRRNAEALDAANDLEAAVAAWEKVADGVPTDSFVLHRFARATLRWGQQIERGLTAASRAVAIDPSRAEYRVTLAALLLSDGRERSALGELEIAERLDPERSDVAAFRAALSTRVRGALS